MAGLHDRVQTSFFPFNQKLRNNATRNVKIEYIEYFSIKKSSVMCNSVFFVSCSFTITDACGTIA